MRLVHVQLRKREHEFGSGEMRRNRKRGSGQRFLALCWSYYTSSLRQARCNTHNSRRHGHLETSKDRSDADLGMTGKKKKEILCQDLRWCCAGALPSPRKESRTLRWCVSTRRKHRHGTMSSEEAIGTTAVTFSLELRVMMSRTLHKEDLYAGRFRLYCNHISLCMPRAARIQFAASFRRDVIAPLFTAFRFV